MKTIVMAVLMLSAQVFAAPAAQQYIDKSVSQYYGSLRSPSRPLNLPEQCNPNPRPVGPSCTDVACGFLGRFGCDDLSQIESVGRACRGNYDGTCLEANCRRLGAFGCDDFAEIQRVAASCRGNYSQECADSVCSHLGSFGCDDLSQVESVGRICRGTDAHCIDSVCARLGTFGCDDFAELERVANSCRGN